MLVQAPEAQYAAEAGLTSLPILSEGRDDEGLSLRNGVEFVDSKGQQTEQLADQRPFGLQSLQLGLDRFLSRLGRYGLVSWQSVCRVSRRRLPASLNQPKTHPAQSAYQKTSAPAYIHVPRLTSGH